MNFLRALLQDAQNGNGTKNVMLGSAGISLGTFGQIAGHANVMIGFLTATAGCVLAIFSAVNAVNSWRDRRAALRKAQAAQAAETTEDDDAES